MPNTIIFIGGTAEKPNSTMMGRVLLNRYFSPDDTFIYLKYPAAIGPMDLTPNPIDFAHSALQSRRAGVKELAREIAETESIPILVGYSLGAWVLSDFLEEMAAGKHPWLEVKSAITIGSPRRRAERFGGGIAGNHGPYPRDVVHVELSNYNDIVSNTPVNSRLKFLPFVGDVLTTNQDADTRRAWQLLAKMYVAGFGTTFTLRDIDLLNRYRDGTGHGSDYFKYDLAKHAAPAFR